MEHVAQDYLSYAVVKEEAVRLAVGSFRELASETIIRHDADPVAGRLLADAFSSAALTGTMLGRGERLSVRFGYAGPAGSIVVDAGSDGCLRGFIRNPHVMEEADSVEVACGEDGATVRSTRSRHGRILRSGESKSAFILPSSALAYHLSVSEEIESELRCEIELQADPAEPVKSAPGVLLQAMPGCDLSGFDRMRRKLQMPEAGEILRTRLGSAPEEGVRLLLAFLLERMDLPAFQLQPLPAARFHCGCSAEALRKTALQILGREEIEKLLAENPNPALRCQFCNTEYHFSAADLP